MKRKVEIAGPFLRCPICGWMVPTTSTYLWCSGCQCEYIKRAGCLIFDTELKRPEYVFAKILERSGGIQIGPEGAIEEGYDG